MKMIKNLQFKNAIIISKVKHHSWFVEPLIDN